MRTCTAVLLLVASAAAQSGFVVTFPAERSRTPIDGRLLVILAAKDTSEPRFQVAGNADCAQVFGTDVTAWLPGDVVNVSFAAQGFPCANLREVPPGDYHVQAIVNRYATFKRSDGHTLLLPPDRGEGQHWQRKPGNLYSKPRQVRVDPRYPMRIELVLDQEIPPVEAARDTDYVKHVKIRSERLSRFWGTDVHLGACVLLPHGFDAHPEARYPLIVYHGHFAATFGNFRVEPPDADLKPDYSDRFQLAGYNRIQQEYAHAIYQAWIKPDMPRLVIIEVQHANPFYDDSYAVNSANLGPYGDAIQYELIPEVEKRFRCLGQGWSRFTYGGSTGGWEALAVQTFYPDEYNGCFAACPDPIDFRAYTIVDIYRDQNAYWRQGPFGRVPRAGMRNGAGDTTFTLEQCNLLELVLGDKSRSGGQWDIWEAVFSPCGVDGYPARIWDKRTGVIDPKVAAHWREHYDLRHILEHDWKTLGPKLAGKIHIFCGTMDNYFLEGAVRRMATFLEGTKDPHYGGVVDFGAWAEHCWNGDHTRPNAISRLRYHLMYVDRIVARMQATAPVGADLKSWRH